MKNKAAYRSKRQDNPDTDGIKFKEVKCKTTNEDLNDIGEIGRY